MKKILLTVLVFLSLSNIFSLDGIMHGQHKLKIAKTDYFDIIYPDASKKSAELIYQNGDSIYNELKNELELSYTFRLPVVISPAQDDFNAYFSSAPFNHIVIYDTPAPETEAYFSQELLGTFRHELIHAITYNKLNKFWKGLDKILGDVYNPALLTITHAFSEGATVSLESEYNEGRLNNEYHKQLLRQTKIEGKNLKYSEIQGSRDTYPKGYLSYYLGGAFNGYLQKTYGMEKYSEFWYRCVNLKNLTYFGCFKKVYGISIKKAWNDFLASEKVPDVKANPADEIFCSDFKSSKNGKKNFVNHIAASEKGLAFYDNYSSNLYFSNAPEYKKSKRILSQTSVSKINLSSDSEFIAITYTSRSSYHPTNKVFIQNLNNGSRFTLKEKNIRDASVFKVGENYFAAAVKTVSQESFLYIYKLSVQKGKILTVDLAFQRKAKDNEIFYSTEGTPEGFVFYISKTNMNYSICSINLFDFSEKQFVLPDGFLIQGLAYVDEHSVDSRIKLSFSYAVKNSLPRLGLFKTDGKNAEIALTEKQSSGGIFEPVYAGNKQFAYSAHLFDQYKVYFADSSKLKAKSQAVPVKPIETEQIPVNEELAVEKASEKFNTLNYALFKSRGIILPVALTNTYKISNSSDSLESYSLPFGLTYITSTPWTIPLFGLSAGYHPYTNSGAVQFFIQGGSYSTDFFKYAVKAQIEFDEDFYKQTFEEISLSSTIPIYGLLNLYLAENFKFSHGNQSLTDLKLARKINSSKNDFGILKLPFDNKWIFEENAFSIGIGNLHKVKAGFYDYSGFTINAIYNQDYSKRLSVPEYEYDNYQNIALELLLMNGALLPVSLDTVIFPAKNYFLASYGKITLFNWEIQKSTNFFPIAYAKRLTLSTGYLARFTENHMKYIDSWEISNLDHYATLIKDNDFKYYDEASANLSLIISPNIGGLTQRTVNFSLNGSFIYRFFPLPDENKYTVKFYTNLTY